MQIMQEHLLVSPRGEKVYYSPSLMERELKRMPQGLVSEY